jgi:hypothetical protein
LRTKLNGVLEEPAIVALAADGSRLTTQEAGAIARLAVEAEANAPQA